MKKKILSLLLVMAMLLSIVPMAGAAGEVAEPKFTGYNLYLQNDIAICFEANRAAIEEGFEKVEFYIGEELVQTRTTLPEADENGNVSFRCTKLTPAQMGETVTAKLYIDGEIKHEFSTSVKDYCMTILRNESNTEAWKNAELRTMLVDMLNYGAATQTYAKASTPLVNADLGDYANLATTGTLSLTDACKIFQYTEVTKPRVTWYGVGLNLKDSITLRYEFIAESVENLAIHFFNDSKTLDAWVTNFEPVEGDENHYYAYFGMLNPTQLSEVISAVAYSDHESSDAAFQSQKLLYTAESYAYAVANGAGYSAELKALTDAMMRYGNAVRCWNCDHTNYVYGRCEGCAKEKVFGMTTDTITIQAEDAVLSLYNAAGSRAVYVSALAVGGKMIIYTQNCYSGVTYNGVFTAADHPGETIVYVTPKVSGAYSVTAKTLTKAAGGIGYLLEDDTTTAASTYTRYAWTKVSSGTTSNSYNNSTDFIDWEIGTASWTAGKTYAIRILSASSNMAIDEFVITHIHTYDNDTDTTCNGCGEVRELPHVCDFSDEWISDATHHWHECECGEKADKVEHTWSTNSSASNYVAGICTVCGNGKLHVLNETTTYVNAKDAELRYKTNGKAALYEKNNTNSVSKKLIQFNSRFTDADGKYIYIDPTDSNDNPVDQTIQHTGETYAGNVVVNVTPTVTGTYSVSFSGIVQSSTAIAVVVEDNNHGANTFYSRLGVSTVSSETDFVTSNTFVTNAIGEGYEWTAGETYSIRIISITGKVAIDQFIITCTNPTE